MFKTILVPTDGSERSDKAIVNAIDYAKHCGAKIVGISVAEPYPFSPLAESSMAIDPGLYEDNVRSLAEQHVKKIADAAQAAGVPCQTATMLSFAPDEEIVNAAKTYQCDVIFMASHGRSGLSRIFLGSKTQKVLAHSSVPVLVLR
ncbi:MULTISPECIES: universal stress protein [unclassified Herbaspirillum]|uniref:universal stress protein n=1 Tax=unclassified Herbaspirillum TaxID=2624150 RepID=UPI0011502E12|nr:MULTISPECIES: universal stress protein [unclassified Herbaspirillum]MBB5392225.1 nucleotide-binding universal stress UspA family protein [Herbaspirillum sp. SJZ102]TQK05867.1 nucleotide-binding universal stress UspA family protein [Herbaspirillum sp. SJZ130]TQK12655.1 nucleotide-binding universal stress UspA family protein [Herbaspirillum sp. SJZ106]